MYFFVHNAITSPPGIWYNVVTLRLIAKKAELLVLRKIRCFSNYLSLDFTIYSLLLWSYGQSVIVSIVVTDLNKSKV